MIFNTKPKVPSLAEMLADQRRKRIAAYRDKVRYTKAYEMECEIEEYLAAEAAKEIDSEELKKPEYLRGSPPPTWTSTTTEQKD